MSRDAGFDDWLDAIEAGEAYYLRCPEGHAAVPPQRVCPDCGADLDETPLSESGTVVSETEVQVSMPQFAEDTPYHVAVASFGPVNLTGQLRGDADADDELVPTVGESATTGERLLCFESR